VAPDIKLQCHQNFVLLLESTVCAYSWHIWKLVSHTNSQTDL